MEAAANQDGLWWTMMVVDSAVGAGMLLYGWRQREPLPLALGVVLNVLPFVPGSGLIQMILTSISFVAFFMLRKIL